MTTPRRGKGNRRSKKGSEYENREGKKERNVKIEEKNELAREEGTRQYSRLTQGKDDPSF